MLALAGLLLLLHTGVGSAVQSRPVASKGKAAGQSATAVVKATPDEAVVAQALSFDFSQVTYLLFTANIRLLTLNRPLLRRLFDSPPF